MNYSPEKAEIQAPSPAESNLVSPLEQAEHTPAFEYSLLRGHARTDGSLKTDEQLRSQYVELTDKLIHLMTDGIIIFDHKTQEVLTEKPDFVVWLDKSARPVSWLTKELWPVLAPDAQGKVPDMPQFRFVNIDREQWVNTIDPTGTGTMNIDKVDDTIIRSLRSIFVAPSHKHGELTKDLDSAPTEFDNKTVMIVDEVRSSGRTLEFSQRFFEKAFPTARIATTYWMGSAVMIDGVTGNADLPVWYKDYTVKGRGVANRDERISQRSKSQTQRLGAWFLSTRLGEPDPASDQLRLELHQLAEDVKNGRMLVVPSSTRDPEDYDERVERFNHMNFAEFKAKKRQIDSAKPTKK